MEILRKQLLQPPPPIRPKTPRGLPPEKPLRKKTKEAREAQKKALADAEERAKKAKEKAARAAKKEPTAAVEPPVKVPAKENPKSDSEGSNTTQWLTLGSIVVGLIGIYYKCEELKAAFKTMGPKAVSLDDGGANFPPPPSRRKHPAGRLLPRAEAAGRWNKVVPFQLFARPEILCPTTSLSKPFSTRRH